MGNIDLKFKSVELYEADNMSKLLVYGNITKEELETVFEELKCYYFIDANDIYGDNHEGATVIFEFSIPSPIFKNIGNRHYYPWNIISNCFKVKIYPLTTDVVLSYIKYAHGEIPYPEVQHPIDIAPHCIRHHYMNAFNFYLDHRKELKVDDTLRDMGYVPLFNNRTFYNVNSN
jgi:hypothetical protein